MNWSWDSTSKVHQWRLLFNNWTLIKSGNKQYTSSRSPLPPNFLCKEILFKLLTFRYAITCKCEESSPRKSLPVLYTPSVGPSRLRILSPLIHKEGHWFELLHERCTEPAPPPFDDFQEGLRAVSRIHSSYQDEPWHLVISLTTGL